MSFGFRAWIWGRTFTATLTIVNQSTIQYYEGTESSVFLEKLRHYFICNQFHHHTVFPDQYPIGLSSKQYHKQHEQEQTH